MCSSDLEGADDFIKKPFSFPEFTARINAQFSRVKRQTTRLAQLGERQFKIGSFINGGNNQKYKITARLATGGMGVIFRGIRISDQMEVVIKTLNSNFLENYKDIQRFLREAEATIRLRHPHIAEGLEVVRTANHCFYVMKYVDGESLANMIEREGHIHPERVLRIIRQIATGLDQFHQFSLVHRDIKPGNILISHNDHAVLVDMGLTKSENSQPDLTTEGVILGTPYYLSPEQALGEMVDIRSDIYSLGATFYHAVTGGVPFHGASTIAIINARFISEIESPRRRAPEISEEIAQIVTRMMARNPAERFQTPGELIETIDGCLGTAKK